MSGTDSPLSLALLSHCNSKSRRTVGQPNVVIVNEPGNLVRLHLQFLLAVELVTIGTTPMVTDKRNWKLNVLVVVEVESRTYCVYPG